MKNKKQATNAQHLYNLICANPGISYGELAKTAGFGYATLVSKLASLDKFGLLVYEDDKNHVWPLQNRGEV